MSTNRCAHLDQVLDVESRMLQGCEECLTTHAIIRSFEPDEDWGWRYVDEWFLEPALSATGRSP